MIDRCVCFNKTFSTILAVAKNNNWLFEDIQKNFKCGTKCGLCVPYIKDCLKTGRTQYNSEENLNSKI